MPGFVRLFSCIARSAVKSGGKALCSLIPFGEVAFEVARDAYDDYCRGHGVADLRADLEQLAQADQAEVLQAAEQVAGAEAAGQPALVRQALTAYLGQVPASVRQSLRRPSDPGGTTVPAGLPLKKAEDLLALLPAGLPRFRPGDRPLAADWELVELLGTGGFGEVWKARHLTRSSVKPVALKFCLDPALAHSLRNEATLHDLLDRVRGQNACLGVVPLLETYLRADPPCLMYELIEGGDLAGLAREMHGQGTLTPTFAARLVQRLAAILAAAHRLDPPIVHRDLKMSNVLIRRGEAGKLTLFVGDFGIGGLAAGRALQDQAAGRRAGGQTLPTAVRGAYTPLYASPQQVAGQPPDPRDDVHALGVIWYQLITGDLGLLAIPADWRDVVEERGLGEDEVRLLASCLASRAEKRPADAGALADRLAALAGTVAPGKQDSAGRTPPVTPPTPARRPRLASSTSRPGKDTWTNTLSNELVRLPADFLPAGQPAGQGLYVCKTCVSNCDYREFVRGGGPPPRVHPKYPDQRTWDDRNTCPDSMLRHPVVYVTQADAVAFCGWLTRKERAAEAIGQQDEYRLPTLAQWRAFARGSRVTPRTVVGRQWLPGQYQPTEPVDHETPNALGLQSLFGNVFEWCADGDAKEVEVPMQGGTGKRKQTVKRFVAVGGGWASTADWLRAEADRGGFGAILCPHGWPMWDGGFRLCLVVGASGKTTA